MSKTNNVITSDIAERELHPASGMLMMIIDIAGVLSGAFLCIIPRLCRRSGDRSRIAADHSVFDHVRRSEGGES